MEAQIINWIATGVIGLLGWFMKRTLDQVEEQQTDLQKKFDSQEREMRNYLHKDDFKEFKVELRLMFDDLKKEIRERHPNV